METGPETCTIFIVGNHEEVPQVTQDYLNDVCRQLTDVVHLADIAGLPNPSISLQGLKTASVTSTKEFFHSRLTIF